MILVKSVLIFLSVKMICQDNSHDNRQDNIQDNRQDYCQDYCQDNG